MSRAEKPQIMSLVVWSALIPVLPFMLASWAIRWPADDGGEPDSY
ncbi:Probable amino-acid metabolite efflux pump [Raoultella planticola]|uniref:Probable amino-acid metabolite efflux pump n=1 Tax=Raoultella planticola TaxID=575 RepID=A0A485AF67_RAOPL|nr:Probable amino-acid metabolite efflux pump [Raoultella planticola]